MTFHRGTQRVYIVQSRTYKSF